MTKEISALIITVSIFAPGLAMSEDMAPPGGPYKSINNNRASSFTEQIPEWVKQRQLEMNNWLKQRNEEMEKQQMSSNKYQPEVPEWVKKNQAEMEQRMKKFNNQAALEKSPAWGQQPPAQWNAPKQHAYPQVNNQQFAQPPANRMQPYFPAARGPVYGPDVPPAGHAYPVQRGPQNYQMQRPQMQRPMNQYQPMWR